MLRGWRPAVMLIFVFAAIMTPTPDAYTMLFLASPMIVLFFASVGIAFIFDRRKEDTARLARRPRRRGVHAVACGCVPPVPPFALDRQPDVREGPGRAG